MAESPDKTDAIPPSFIIDAKGKLWSITPDALKGMMVITNGVIDKATANVAMLYYFNHEIYYKNTANNWFVRRTTWQASTDPTTYPLAAESEEGTTVTIVGPSIINAIGEVWTLSNTGAQPMQVAVNGTPDTTTAQVVKLYYSNHTVYQSNSAGGWWSKTKSSDAWTTATDPTPVTPPVTPPKPTESPNGTNITTVGPAITNSTGELWTLANTGAQPMQVAVNGTSDTTTAQVVSLFYNNHMVYQSNSAGGWWSKTKSSDAWTTASDPTGAPPVIPPVTQPPSSTVTAPAQAASAGYSRLAFEDDFITTSTIAKAQFDKTGYNWYFAQRNGQPANPSEWTVNTSANAGSISNGNNGGGAKASAKGGILQLKTGLFPNANLISIPGWAMNSGMVTMPPMGTGHWKQCYMEAYIQYVPDQNAPSKVYTATGWPAFWSWAAEGIGDYGFPGTNLHTPDTIEVDFLEQFGYALWQNGSANPLKQWSSGVINHGTGGIGGGGGSLGGGAIDANWHSYGFLWVPGKVSMYFDDRKMSDFALTAGAAKLDNQSLFITLGTGPNWLMNIDYVQRLAEVRFCQIMSNIDVGPLLGQLEQHPELWNNDPSWVEGKPLLYATDNIVLRYNRSSLPGIYDWNRVAFSHLSAAQSIVFDLMRQIPGEHLGKVMISRMPPGDKIDWHIDQMPPGMLPYYQRYQVPLQVAEGVHFVVEDEDLYMAPGTAWWFDNQRLHAVFNESEEVRLSLFADIRPFVPVPL